jgi:hypothetical protein
MTTATTVTAMQNIIVNKSHVLELLKFASFLGLPFQ